MAEKRLLSWNVNGIRAIKNKGFFEWFYKESPDILCLQETKAQPDQLDDDLKEPKGYQRLLGLPGEKGLQRRGCIHQRKAAEVRYDFGERHSMSRDGLSSRNIRASPCLISISPTARWGPERLNYKMKFYDVFLNYADSLKAPGKNWSSAVTSIPPIKK